MGLYLLRFLVTKGPELVDSESEGEADFGNNEEPPAGTAEDVAGEEEQLDKGIFVTPLLDSAAIVDLMADAVPSDDFVWQAEKIRRGIELVHPEVDDSRVQDEELVKITHLQKVYCASGESDTDSIRDHDSGPGAFRWNLRTPYHYRHNPCLENNKNYRRKMKPNFQFQNDVGEASLLWEPEYPSDEDGFNEQPSFALSAQVATDQQGHKIGAHPDIQPTKTSRSEFQEAWQTMFGTRFTDEKTGSMLALTDKYRVVRRQVEITDDEVNQEIVAEILDEFQKAMK